MSKVEEEQPHLKESGEETKKERIQEMITELPAEQSEIPKDIAERLQKERDIGALKR